MTDHEKLFENYVQIAYSVFGTLTNSQEGKSLAEFAVHEAILTHDTKQASLSTLVHLRATYHKTEYIRHLRRWSGHSSYTKLHTRYATQQQYVLTASADQSVLEIETIHIDHDKLFVKECLEYLQQLEPTRLMFRNRLVSVMKLWLIGYNNAEISKQLDIKERTVSRIIIEAIKELQLKFNNLTI